MGWLLHTHTHTHAYTHAYTHGYTHAYGSMVSKTKEYHQLKSSRKVQHISTQHIPYTKAPTRIDSHLH